MNSFGLLLARTGILRRSLARRSLLIAASVVCLAAVPRLALGANTVVAETKSIGVGTTNQVIRLKITNDEELKKLTVPLIIRELDPGAFITKLAISYGDRINGSILSDTIVRNQYATADGSTCGTSPGFSTVAFSDGASHAVASSPEGVMFRRTRTPSGSSNLPIGSDSQGSLILTVDAGPTAGRFEIDTTCVDPDWHLSFLDKNNATPAVGFTKGTITLVNSCPTGSAPAPVTAPVGSLATNQVNATDTESDPITYAVVSGSKGSINSSGLWSYTPICSDVPGFDVSIYVSDNQHTQSECLLLTFHVNVSDTTRPVVNCPSSFTVRTALGACDTTVSFDAAVSRAATATDNCGTVSVTYACLDSGVVINNSVTPRTGKFPKGAHTVTATATDGANLTSTCQFTVTVSDTIHPTITTCPGAIEVPTSGSSCDTTITFSSAVNREVIGTDNCNTVTVTYSCPDAGVVINNGVVPRTGKFPKGAHTVTATVTDGASLTATCQFTVTVVDMSPPSIICPATFTPRTSASGCDTTITFSAGANRAASATDNCGLVTITYACSDSGVEINNTLNPPTGKFPKGPHTVTATVRDGVNLTASCQFTVTVVDGTPPVINCPSSFTVRTALGACDTTVSFDAAVSRAATATDNCGTVSVTYACLDSGVVINNSVTPRTGKFPKGAHTVTATATDGANLTSTCQFTVTVSDTIHPTITTCPGAIEVPTSGSSCDTTITFSSAVNREVIGTDNCNTVTVTYSCPDAGVVINNGVVPRTGKFPKGAHTVTATVTDGASLTATCQFTVTVVDTTRPQFQNLAARGVGTDSDSCFATVNLDTLSISAHDNCAGNRPIKYVLGTDTLTGRYKFSKALSPFTITVVASDDAVPVNTRVGSFVLTVSDAQSPRIISKPDSVGAGTVASGCDALVSFKNKVTAIDNCDVPKVVYKCKDCPVTTPSEDTLTIPPGRHVIAAEATDGVTSNPATQVEFIVGVVDNVPPAHVSWNWGDRILNTNGDKDTINLRLMWGDNCTPAESLSFDYDPPIDPSLSVVRFDRPEGVLLELTRQSASSSDSVLLMISARDRASNVANKSLKVWLRGDCTIQPHPRNSIANVREDIVDTLLTMQAEESGVTFHPTALETSHGHLDTIGLNTLGTGRFHYTPTANYAGPDVVVFSVRNSEGCFSGSPGNVSITVAPVNDSPIARDTLLAVSGASQVIALPYSDVDAGQSFKFRVSKQPVKGTASIPDSTKPSLVYTPNPTDTGSDSLRWTVTDNGTPPYSDEGYVAITISRINNPPVARDTSDTAYPGIAKFFDYNSATDPDFGQTLSYILEEGPFKGIQTGFNTTSGSFTYTANVGATGSDSVRILVCDNGSPSLCTSATIRLSISPLSHGVACVSTVAFGQRNSQCGVNSSLGGTAKQLTIKNIGNINISVTDINPRGANAGKFNIIKTISPPLPRTLAPNATLTFDATYCPSTESSTLETADVVTKYSYLGSVVDSSRCSGSLTGQGVCASMTRQAKSEGAAFSEATSSTFGKMTAWVKNTSTVVPIRVALVPSTTSRCVSDLGSQNVFTLDPLQDDSLTLAPGESDTVSLVFHPSSGLTSACRYEGKLLTTPVNPCVQSGFTQLIGLAYPRHWRAPSGLVCDPSSSCDTCQKTFQLTNIFTGVDLTVDRIQATDSRFTVDTDSLGRNIPFEGELLCNLEYNPGGFVGVCTTGVAIWYHETVGGTKYDSVPIPNVATGTSYRPGYELAGVRPDSVLTKGPRERDSIAVVVRNNRTDGGKGNALLALDPCNLSGSSAFSLPSPCRDVSIAAGDSAKIFVYTSSGQLGTHQATLTLTARKFGAGCVDEVVKELPLKLHVVDNQPPGLLGIVSPGGSTLTSASYSTPDEIDVLLKDNYGVASAKIELRRLNAPEGVISSAIACSLKRDSTDGIRIYGAEIPASFAGMDGYEYRVTAKDAASPANDTSFGWQRRMVHFTGQAIARPQDSELGEIKLDGKWYMLGVPGLLDGQTPESVFMSIATPPSGLSTPYDTDWRLYPAHNADAIPAAIGYKEVSVFSPGKAVWFRHRPKGAEALSLRLPPGQTSPSTSAAVFTFDLPLVSNGWTMFSNPFLFDVYLPVNSSGLPQSTSALLRGRQAGYFNDGSGERIGTGSSRSEMTYLRDSAGQNYAVLQPWVGYAIRTSGLTTLTLNPHPPSDPQHWTSVALTAPQGKGVTLSMSSGTQRLGEISCGISTTAESDWDPADWPLFSAPHNAGEFYISHDDWGDLSGKYTIDVRDADGRGEVYQLGLHQAGGPGESRLNVESVADLPSGVGAVLFDRAAEKRVELAAGTTYAFRSELEKDDTRLVVLIGDAAFLEQWAKQEQSGRPVTYELSPNYPNPFNAGTVIGFTLPRYARVSLEVYNILGQRVRTLADGPMHPGVHQFEFDGADNSGHALAAGVYFYRLRTELGTKSRKMVLLK